MPHGLSSDGYEFGQCTNYVAWRLDQAGIKVNYGAFPSDWNANRWARHAADLGFRVDHTPAVGAVAQLTGGNFGHVSVVYAVNPDGSVLVEDYNWAYDLAYHNHPMTQVDNYIHFGDEAMAHAGAAGPAGGLPFQPPTIAIGMSPDPGRDLLVNLPTWLWVTPLWAGPVAPGGPETSLPPALQSVIWDMGNGDTVTCNGPGTPYDPGRAESAQTSSCSYTYRRASAAQPNGRFTVTATPMWRSAPVGGTGSSGGPGAASTVAGPSASLQIRVVEAQGLNIAPSPPSSGGVAPRLQAGASLSYSGCSG
jgi:hypothetical protein